MCTYRDVKDCIMMNPLECGGDAQTRRLEIPSTSVRQKKLPVWKLFQEGGRPWKGVMKERVKKAKAAKRQLGGNYGDYGDYGYGDENGTTTLYTATTSFAGDGCDEMTLERTCNASYNAMMDYYNGLQVSRIFDLTAEQLPSLCGMLTELDTCVHSIPGCCYVMDAPPDDYRGGHYNALDLPGLKLYCNVWSNDPKVEYMCQGPPGTPVCDLDTYKPDCFAQVMTYSQMIQDYGGWDSSNNAPFFTQEQGREICLSGLEIDKCLTASHCGCSSAQWVVPASIHFIVQYCPETFGTMWEYCAGSLEGLCGGVADILL
ncbi:unnamed protein product, partial [Durusdinium trenchii]